MDENSKT
jgi:hypothetical protein